MQSFDLDRVCLTARWPKCGLKDGGEWSAWNIIDWKEFGGNNTVSMQEKYTPDDLTIVIAAIRILKDVFSTRMPLQGYRVDLEMAFRQEPVDPKHQTRRLQL